jgi:hypothetical protein
MRPFALFGGVAVLPVRSGVLTADRWLDRSIIEAN